MPDEIAAAISPLLSDDAGSITGQTLYVHGGASIGKAPFLIEGTTSARWRHHLQGG